MAEPIRMASIDVVNCRCPDGRVERVRAVAMEQDNGLWEAWSTEHGPGTDCAMEGHPARDSRREIRDLPNRAEAIAWLQRATGRTNAAERYAVCDADLETVRAYLPANYHAAPAETQNAHGGNRVSIWGTDDAGWTLDGYVIPRLGSGLIWAREVPLTEWPWPPERNA